MREINGCHSTSAYASKDIRIFHGECASLVKVVQPTAEWRTGSFVYTLILQG